MYIPVCAATPIAIAVLFLQFSAGRSYRLLLDLLAMDVVLVVQLARRAPASQLHRRPTTAADGVDRRAKAKQEALRGPVIPAGSTSLFDGFIPR